MPKAQKNKIKIMIAEDHPLMRKAYVDLIVEHGNLYVVGEASNGRELLALLKDVETDIVLLDLSMPVMTGGEAFETIKKKYPHIKVIIISTHFDDTYVAEYFLKGVNGYLSKSGAVEEIVEAINSVINEEFYFTKVVSKSLLRRMIKEKGQKEILDVVNLTDVELKILQRICEEKSSKQIALELGMTQYSIDHHRRNIQAKTQQSTAIGLFKFAVKNGIAEI